MEFCICLSGRPLERLTSSRNPIILWDTCTTGWFFKKILMFKEASLDRSVIFLLFTLSPFLGVFMPQYTKCLLGKSFAIKCVCVWMGFKFQRQEWQNWGSYVHTLVFRETSFKEDIWSGRTESIKVCDQIIMPDKGMAIRPCFYTGLVLHPIN